MTTNALPAKTKLVDIYPNPSNAVFKEGIGELYDHVESLLGATGTPADARAALNAAALADVNAYTAANYNPAESMSGTTGSVALDLDASNNFKVMLTGDLTLVNPTNMKLNQTGFLKITNGSTPFTIAYGSCWAAFDDGDLPELTATAGFVDTLVYEVESATKIRIGKVS